MILGFRWGSLRAKILAWMFIPTAILLIAVALVAVQAFRAAAERLVIERDRELARLYARDVAAQIDDYLTILADSIAEPALLSSDPEAAREALAAASDRLVEFDGGLVLLDPQGVVIGSEPHGLAAPGDDWSDRGYFRSMLRTGEPVVSDIVPDGLRGGRVVALIVPATGTRAELRGALVGMVRIGSSGVSPFTAALARLPVAEGSKVLVLDGLGRLVYHTDVDRAGADYSSSPAAQRALGGEGGAERTTGIDGRAVLASFAPVPHGQWALVIEEPWAALTSGSRQYTQVLLLLIVLGVAIPAYLVTQGVKRITEPIAELITAAQEVAQGRFGRTIAADTGDEIEQLAEQFNLMSRELERSYRELEARVAARTRELAASSEAARRRAEQFRVITEVGQRMTSLIVLDELLDHIVRVIQQAFSYHHVGIGLIDDDDDVVYRAGAGPLWDSPSAAFRPGRLRVGRDGITGAVASSGRPMLVPDVSREPRYIDMEGSRARSELTVPLVAKGRVIGVLDVQSTEIGAFDESDLAVMQSLANQAAIAIENAQLYEHARSLAVVEERQRVARDLHDSVTQSLYGVTLYADGAARLLSADQVDAAAGYLDQLRDTAREALRQMRLLIFELRPPELETVGLVAAVQGRLDAVESRAGMVAELSADGDIRASPETEEALYRIAQEALNNALKHSRARNVRVALSRTEKTLRLTIEDDGVGFDVAAAEQSGGLGFRSMRERAARLGGTLHIESEPDSGTRLVAEVPL